MQSSTDTQSASYRFPGSPRDVVYWLHKFEVDAPVVLGRSEVFVGAEDREYSLFLRPTILRRPSNSEPFRIEYAALAYGPEFDSEPYEGTPSVTVFGFDLAKRGTSTEVTAWCNEPLFTDEQRLLLAALGLVSPADEEQMRLLDKLGLPPPSETPADTAGKATSKPVKRERGPNSGIEAKVNEAHGERKAGVKWDVIEGRVVSRKTYQKWCKHVTGEDPI